MQAARKQRVCIAGASGRMGHMLIDAVLASDDLALAGALDMAGSASIGLDAGAYGGHDTGVRVDADVRKALGGCDVLIDFTRPEGTLAHLAVCRALGVNAVIGTTGFSEAQKTEVAEAAKAAINSPLLELSIDGAKGVLFNISGSSDLTMLEVNEAANVITENIDPNAKVIFGTVVDDQVRKGEIQVTVVATGFDDGSSKESPIGLVNVVRQSAATRPVTRSLLAPS